MWSMVAEDAVVGSWTWPSNMRRITTFALKRAIDMRVRTALAGQPAVKLAFQEVMLWATKTSIKMKSLSWRRWRSSRSPLPSRLINGPSNPTKAGFSHGDAELHLIMACFLLVMARKMALNIGRSKIHGALDGVTKAT